MDGVIVIGAYPEDFYEGLNLSNIPIVLLDSYLENHEYKEVKLDDIYGGYIATKYFPALRVFFQNTCADLFNYWQRFCAELSFSAFFGKAATENVAVAYDERIRSVQSEEKFFLPKALLFPH